MNDEKGSIPYGPSDRGPVCDSAIRVETEEIRIYENKRKTYNEAKKTCSTAAGIGAAINAGVKNCNNQWDNWIIDENHVCGKASILRMAG